MEELAVLLKARAAAKVMAKSANRTMVAAEDNNPLKFIPAPPEIIEMMFARRRPGYLDAERSVDEAFADLKIARDRDLRGHAEGAGAGCSRACRRRRSRRS